MQKIENKKLHMVYAGIFIVGLAFATLNADDSSHRDKSDRHEQARRQYYEKNYGCTDPEKMDLAEERMKRNFENQCAQQQAESDQLRWLYEKYEHAKHILVALLKLLGWTTSSSN